MTSAVDQRLQFEAAAHVECTDAFRRIELMTSDRQQVDAEFVDVGRDLADRLGRIGVKANPALPRDRADLLDRLDGADLVVWRA